TRTTLWLAPSLPSGLTTAQPPDVVADSCAATTVDKVISAAAAKIEAASEHVRIIFASPSSAGAIAAPFQKERRRANRGFVGSRKLVNGRFTQALKFEAHSRAAALAMVKRTPG